MTRSLLLALLLALASSGCSEPQPVHHNRFLAFGTLVDLDISGVSQQAAEQATAAIQADFDYMHHAWHAWDPGPLGYVNRMIRTGEPFAVPPSVLPLIEIGQRLSQQSEQLFDPAIGQLIELWGFHRKKEPPQPPDETTIQALLDARPSITDLKLNGITLQSDNPQVKLDFGAFGKGYGIDLAIDHLRQLGIRNAIVNAGGDLRAIGNHGDRPWRIAIRDPSGEGVFAVIEIDNDESVFTSGDYERNFVYQGRRYHHIIDPRNGYPATGSRSVTVIHTDATTADAAATALFIAGPRDWYRIARSMRLKYVLLVDDLGELHMSPAMAQRIELTNPNLQIQLSEAL
ncbi:FAD:protein FMN transferase [Candidatus Endoriftia persephone]|uniref:FAD:protein FMN transferase n=3 Tax=Gammaproteobacteria TaxID=1236 RepID=G2FJD5_9GAMM|nr:FAD:protein FMN transferase [Candidatus Endoriftia persephone]EGV50958.1 thiamin biosynthesis lipoprotein ApbE [endosymbiont of Riftia pachyptila (vent Ph05)]EGW53082.1 thiamine biosynthesis lipoprotein ApbE [endosymbiont of Tevnia jerichonana (vent Tica)]USF88236.1 FAD:protein FMN transferase [Candidatus Endoriftia persephone]